MKVLIVNYYYPPVMGAHSYRWHQIAQHWNAAGHEVHVVTSKVAGVPMISDESGVEVCRTGLVAQQALSRSAGVATESAMSFKSNLVNLFRPLYRKIYWPDAMYHWLPFVFWQMWRRRKVSYDAVITFYPAFSSGLSGWFYRKVSRDRSFVWVADYGDPFSTSGSMPPNNYAVYRRLNIVAERFIAREIDRLVLTSTETMEDYLAAGIAPEDKLEVIPGLVDIDLFYTDEKLCADTAPLAEIHLVYIGALHVSIREPGILYQLVAALNEMHVTGPRIILDMYGPSNGVDVAPIENPWVRYHGPVVREDAVALMRGSQILVDIGNDNCSMIPSKMTEYVATGKAILEMKGNGICHPAMTRYEEIGRVLMVDKHCWESADLDQVWRFINEMAGSCIGRATVEDVLEPYALKGIALRYERLIREAKTKSD